MTGAGAGLGAGAGAAFAGEAFFARRALRRASMAARASALSSCAFLFV